MINRDPNATLTDETTTYWRDQQDMVSAWTLISCLFYILWFASKILRPASLPFERGEETLDTSSALLRPHPNRPRPWKNCES